ncbi:MarR family winged helix-turn-helix transcriptional regulator [Stackebrandtia nassauensis]|uniref:Transcriptional regulator, MarR family n=1 Tax=Stackebrandtia nassauensis (strain DSM 44728 / CIP 108903 / NRRL B-16338 / NBRC 102104 / LLR-40K-21) TaxID=446470 RepID=D3Q3I4_STANL|nr:MarR family transcriptional regulator [Stackebrandtia nassauensis]ADD42025.1 transcriptional regulator, MarR family [Stackebrandtia nassauensis DSM 44728]
MTPDANRLAQQLQAMQTGLTPQILRGTGQDELQLIDVALLSALTDGRELTVKGLAATIGRSVSRTSRLIDRLVCRELLERREHPTDRRARYIKLSPAGAAFMSSFRTARAEQIARILDHLSPQEQTIVSEALDLIAKAARKSREEPDSGIF